MAAPEIDPHWWSTASCGEVPLRSSLARHDMAAVFGFLHRRGFSWVYLSALTRIGAGRISEIASRQRMVCDYDVLERIAEGLKIPRHYMGLGRDHVATALRGPDPNGDPGELDTQEMLGAVAAIAVGAIPADTARWLPSPDPLPPPKRVTANDVATLRAVTALHRRLDAGLGGGACLYSARGYIGLASRLMSAPRIPQEVAIELTAALADLHNLIGWSAHDLDLHDLARRHLVKSLVLGRRANAFPLMANVLYRLGRISLHQRDPRGALQMFGLGQMLAQQARCTVSSAVLHANMAWAYAMLGQEANVRDSMRRAATELAAADPDTAPEWCRFALAEADPHGMSALVYIELAQHEQCRGYLDKAAGHAREAVRLRSAEGGRSYVFDVISLATASALMGDLDEALMFGTRACELARPESMSSARVSDRLQGFWRTAQRALPLGDGLTALGRRIEGLGGETA